jgi:hypothetical protein
VVCELVNQAAGALLLRRRHATVVRAGEQSKMASKPAAGSEEADLEDKDGQDVAEDDDGAHDVQQVPDCGLAAGRGRRWVEGVNA